MVGNRKSSNGLSNNIKWQEFSAAMGKVDFPEPFKTNKLFKVQTHAIN
jgi:hypothetical protein